MLKKVITNIEDVEEKFQDLYEAQSDGTYRLKVEEDDGLDGLKRNQQRLKAEKIKLKEKLEQLERELNEKLEHELEEKGQYKELLAKKENEYKEMVEREKQRAESVLEQFKGTLLNSELTKLSVELAGERAPLIQPHIKERIVIDEVDGNFVVKYRDANGNLVDRPDAIIEEFKNNDLFSPVLQGRNSSGGGAVGAAGGSGASNVGSAEKYFNPSSPDYSPTKQAEIQSEKPDVYDALIKKFALDDPFAGVGFSPN